MTALTFVNAAAGFADGPSTIAVTPAWALTAGNHVFVYVRWEGNASPTITVTDTAGNTYTALSAVWGGGQVAGQWFYCLNAKGSGGNNVAVTFNTGTPYKNVRAIELSGTAPTVTLTSASGSTGSLTLPGTVTDNAGSMLLIGSSTYNIDTGHGVSGLGTWTQAGAAYNYADTYYLARPAGDSAATPPTYSGASTSRVLQMLTLDVGNAPATSVRPQVFVCC